MPYNFELNPTSADVLTPAVIAAFWKHVPARPNNECWHWNGVRSDSRYGLMCFKHAGRTLRYKAPRMSWLIHFGEFRNTLLVCHKCDVPSCVNPDHLFLGTVSDNMRDQIAKGLRPGRQHLGGVAAAASMTAAERQERARRGGVALAATLTPEQRSDRQRKAAQKMTREQRVSRATKAAAAREALRNKAKTRK